MLRNVHRRINEEIRIRRDIKKNIWRDRSKYTYGGTYKDIHRWIYRKIHEESHGEIRGDI